MNTGGNIYELRRWMYDFKDADGTVREAYGEGVEIFMYQAGNTPETIQSGKMFCPCTRCKNKKYVLVKNVWNHLCLRGFTPNYYIWYKHGEGNVGDVASSSNPVEHGIPQRISVFDNWGDHGGHDDRVNDMVTEAFLGASENVGEVPNEDAANFYDMLDNANQPIYEGCRSGLSSLSLAARMMSIKTDNNLSESCMNSWTELFKEYLPEENVAADSYYDIQKMVHSLGLPSEIIDVCVDNCMIFWRDDNLLQECKFCKKTKILASR